MSLGERGHGEKKTKPTMKGKESLQTAKENNCSRSSTQDGDRGFRENATKNIFWEGTVKLQGPICLDA